jgi:uncharacterized protein YciI
MKTVISYENRADATMEQFIEVCPRHPENEAKFVKAGKVLGIGPFSIPGEGAMGIFVDRESAEDFVKNDPFVQECLVDKVTMREWHDELL